MKWLYNTALFLLTLILLPKYIWEGVRYGKHRKSFLEKLGLKVPDFTFPQGHRIWIHAVSVGETKAVAPLVAKIRDHFPHLSVVFSTTTETGLAEARRSIPGLDHYFYLPLDFSWTISRLIRRLRPDLLVLVESDFWFNLVSLNKATVLVNGKISETSQKWFRFFSFFSRRLFDAFGLLCVQSDRYAVRFKSLGIDPAHIIGTGNLKFDQPFVSIDILRWKKDLGITAADRVITIGSTHSGEEEKILDALQPLLSQFPSLKILLVPRHPERFASVASLLEQKGIRFSRFSDHAAQHADQRVILIDAMGILSACYQLSEIAIVGGSFVAHVGGHNIFEPAALGIPVLFGPHMESQRDLVEIIVHAGAGIETSLSDLPSHIEKMLLHPPRSMKEAGLKLAAEVHGATERTFQRLSSQYLSVFK